VASPPRDFLREDERAFCDEFLRAGFVKSPVEDRAALDAIRTVIADAAAGWLGASAPADAAGFLNGIHARIGPDRLNEFRLHIARALNDEPWLRAAYYALGRRALDAIAGNELVMQRHVNLSIQLPGDADSLLPVHSDVWAGDSPYEVVLWVPYVDCARTKSMFFCDPARDAEVQSRLADWRGRSADDLYAAIERDVRFIDVAYGEILIFTQNVLHGNRVNVEPETRWSTNCRFKSALSPYADKKLGEFFEPITLRPATRLGLRYELPKVDHE
jgi:sporadic carbohydrate cluster 2OG-Fe(II) oxygenase